MQAESIDVNALFPSEVRSKRINKELSMLKQLKIEDVELFEVKKSTIGLHIPFRLTHNKKTWNFELRIDWQYPFNHPQMHCLDTNHNLLAQGRDLLDLYFEEDDAWIPSVMLQKFIGDIRIVIDKVEQNCLEVQGVYWPSEYYDRRELLDKGLRLYNVTQFSWLYVIKQSSQKLLGLGKHHMLIFTVDAVQTDKLKLQAAVLLKSITSVQSDSHTKDISIKYESTQEKEVHLNLGEHFEEIASVVDPIHTALRRVTEAEHSNMHNKGIIEDYSLLVEHYSTKNPEMSEFYLQKMKKIIEKLNVQ